MNRSARFWAVGLWAGLSTLALGCGDDDTSELVCGAGTVQKDGACVPQNAAGGGSQAGSGGSLTCGDGTVMQDGKCVSDPAKKLECGDGTVAKDGKCVVAPPEPPNIESLVISQLSLRNNGQLVADDDTLTQYYPVQVSIGLKYKGDAAKIPVVFALGEPPQDGKAPEDLAFCLIGGFDIDHPGGTNATESIASATFQIPKGCLKNSGQKVSPIVMVDPDRTLNAKDQDAVTRMVGFMKENKEDADIGECRVDATESGAKGTCALLAKLDPSPGLDFALAELTAESSVVVLDRCPPNADMDRPPSYRCNSSIVPEFKIKRDNAGLPELDANGNKQVLLDDQGRPIQETYSDGGTLKPKFVYGMADLALDVTVITYGEDDSMLSNADQAVKVDPTKPQDATNNALKDHGLQIKYLIRPANDETAWKPLYLHEQGEQAKAGEEGESGQNPTDFEDTDIVPATPSYYSHGLYVENDCGERNKATCDATLNPRTDIVSGDWSNTSDFLVRACLVPVDDAGDEDAGFDKAPGNNCKEIPIKIVRHDTSASSGSASSYAYNYQWSDGVGSQTTLRLAWGFHTWNKIDTAGLTVDNEGAITLGSNLIGYTDIMKGWAKGAAYVSLVGSYYDYGLSTFGVKLWGDSKVVNEFHWERDWSVSKELRRGAIVWAGCIPINLEIKFVGTAGVVVNIDVIGVNTPLSPDEESETFLNSKTAGSSRIGLAQLTITPYGNMTVTASASITAGVARAGVAGNLTLLDLRTPITGRLWWGLTQLSPVKLKMGAWGDLKLTFSTMNGEIYLFAENYSVEWCSKRIRAGWIKITVKYPCGANWNTFWDYDIADWEGWTWNQTLWASPYVEAAIP